MKTAEKITEELWKQFGDRKTKGRIDFVVNTKTRINYPVPRDIEHKEFIPRLPGYIQQSSFFVPVQIRVENGEITENMVGISSYESEHNVRHKEVELNIAYRTAWELISKSDFSVKIKRDKVFR